MKTEDQLTRAERIRLEALAQAIAAFGARATTAQELLDSAEEIEAWLYKAYDHTAMDSEADPKEVAPL